MKTTLLIILAILTAMLVLTILVAAYNINSFKRKVSGEIDAIFNDQPQCFLRGDEIVGRTLQRQQITGLDHGVATDMCFADAVALQGQNRHIIVPAQPRLKERLAR